MTQASGVGKGWWGLPRGSPTGWALHVSSVPARAPASFHDHVQPVLEIRDVAQHVLQRATAALQPGLPGVLRDRSEHNVLVADHLRGESVEALGDLRFELILVHDEQFAARAIATGLAQGERAPAVNVEEESELPEMCQPPALRAPAQPFAGVRVQDE